MAGTKRILISGGDGQASILTSQYRVAVGCSEMRCRANPILPLCASQIEASIIFTACGLANLGNGFPDAMQFEGRRRTGRLDGFQEKKTLNAQTGLEAW